MAEAADQQDAMRTVPEPEPDLLVLDVSMPGGSAVPTVATLVHEQPKLAVLMLTMNDEARSVAAALPLAPAATCSSNPRAKSS